MKALACERKLVGTAQGEEFALSLLKHVCFLDPEYPSGIISSIYYDTPRLASYNEKLNGELFKTKVRLRWYDEAEQAGKDQINVFLELKLKEGSGRRKIRQRLILDREWFNHVSLENDALRELVYRHGADFLEMLPADLFPVITVTFDRLRFVCPFSGCRVCLDTSIRTGRVNSALIPSVGTLPFDAVVVEIKGAQTAEVPWLGDLYRVGFRQRSFSKYGICMSKII